MHFSSFFDAFRCIKHQPWMRTVEHNEQIYLGEPLTSFDIRLAPSVIRATANAAVVRISTPRYIYIQWYRNNNLSPLRYISSDVCFAELYSSRVNLRFLITITILMRRYDRAAGCGVPVPLESDVASKLAAKSRNWEEKTEWTDGCGMVVRGRNGKLNIEKEAVAIFRNLGVNSA